METERIGRRAQVARWSDAALTAEVSRKREQDDANAYAAHVARQAVLDKLAAGEITQDFADMALGILGA